MTFIKQDFFSYSLKLLLFLFVIHTGLQSCHIEQQRPTSNDRKPNILIFVSDDQGYPYASAYGCKFVNTPSFDSIASQGILFTNSFVGAPQCSPSRASILTGKHIWQIGSAGTHASTFSAGIPVYTDILEEHGYQVGYTGKGWGPGSWIDGGRSTNPAGVLYDDIADRYTKDYPEKRWADGISADNYASSFTMFLSERDKNKPFCFWMGGHEPHRTYEKGSGLRRGKKLSSVTVPDYLPDIEEIRSDFLDYAVEIEWFDMQVGRALKELEKEGQLDNTLCIFVGDNGMPFPRAKAFCFDAGVHTPLAIMWGKGIKNPGRTVNDLISMVDIFPTILEAAGLKDLFSHTQGKSLFNIFKNGKTGVTDTSRKCVFFGRERHSDSRWHNLGYPERAVRTDQYLYIWNLRPERYPAGAPMEIIHDTLAWAYQDIDNSPSKTYMILHQNDTGSKYNSEELSMNSSTDKRTGTPVPLFKLAFYKFPQEMLYDIKKDPYCIHNLAEDPHYQKIIAHLSSILKQKLKETNDPRLGETPDIWESYRRYGVMREFPQPDWAKKMSQHSTVTK